MKQFCTPALVITLPNSNPQYTCTAAMGWPTQTERACAVAAMLIACNFISDAVPEFNRLCPDHTVLNVRPFLAHWGYASSAYDGSLVDRPRKARPPYLSDDEAKQCVKWALKNNWSHGKSRHYHDMQEVGTHLPSHATANLTASTSAISPRATPPSPPPLIRSVKATFSRPLAQGPHARAGPQSFPRVPARVTNSSSSSSYEEGLRSWRISCLEPWSRFCSRAAARLARGCAEMHAVPRLTRV